MSENPRIPIDAGEYVDVEMMVRNHDKPIKASEQITSLGVSRIMFTQSNYVNVYIHIIIYINIFIFTLGLYYECYMGEPKYNGLNYDVSNSCIYCSSKNIPNSRPDRKLS